MKKFIQTSIALALFMGLFATPQYLTAQGSDFSIEKVSKECKGLPREKRIRLTVARFSVSSRAAQNTGQFGDELTTIMTNAIQQINCFRVLESTKNFNDLQGEIGINESGATNGSGPQRGKMMGAQAIMTAEITEYSEGKTGVSLIGVSVGKDKAKIGLIVKMLDPETRELLWSKSVNGEGAKSGLKGMKIFGVDVAGSSKLSEAMSAAVEDIVFKTVSLLVKEREDIEKMLPNPMEGLAKPKQWNSSNCALLQSANQPKVMVIIPEYHITKRIPDPAGETEILKKFTEAGFRAVDPAMFASIRYDARFNEAVKNPTAAISMGREFGADIVIFGEAFSELVTRDANAVTCRARVEARAVRTDNAEILATNGLQAGGQDIAESTASKTALRNAGTQMADYLLGQLCSKNPSFANVEVSPKGLGQKTVITVKNVNFAKLNSLANTLKGNSKVKDVQKSLTGTEGSITINHDGSSEDIAELINNSLAAQFEITGVDIGKISLSGK